MSAEKPLPDASRSEREPVVYCLDQDDRIIAIEGDWTSLSEDPVGHEIWRYVRGADVTSLYEHIFKQVRSTQEARFPYRCDSPTHCHRIEMSVCPGPNRTLVIRSECIESRKRAKPLHVQAVASGYEIALRCSICNSFGRRGDWKDVLELAGQHSWFDTDDAIRVHYSVCPACRRNIRKAL